MDIYIYAADTWCEDCANAIKEQLDKEGKTPEDPNNEHTFDSDEYPKGPFDSSNETTDSPDHCAAGAECLNAIVDGDQKYGCWLEQPLTNEGVEYTLGMIRDTIVRSIDAPEFMKYWVDELRDYGLETEDEVILDLFDERYGNAKE